MSLIAAANAGTISDIAFECIADDYYWGRYGEFRVIINIVTGYINATHLCGLTKTKTGRKKEFKQWRRLDSTKNIVNAVGRSLGLDINSLIVIPTNLPNELRGTYVHHELIPHIASWADPIFAVAVMKVITKYIIDRDRRQRAIHATTSASLAEQLHTRADARDDLTRALLPPDNALGCVYFIGSGEFTKIGYTYDLPKRLCGLQTGNPMQLTILHTIITTQPIRVEADLHVMFADYRGLGEWFQLPANAINRVKQLYNE